MSKFVAERHAVGNVPEQREVLRLAAAMMMVFGAAGAILLYFGAPLLARLIGSSLIVPALQAAAPALLFYPVSAALRGIIKACKICCRQPYRRSPNKRCGSPS